MERSLKRNLALSYALVAILCILFTSILANVFLEKQFKNYVISNLEKRNNDIVSSISQGYTIGEKWNTDVIENIGIDAMQNGLIISVKDLKGNIIWDAKKHNNGFCQAMISHISQNMMSRYPTLKGGYMENKYSIVKSGINIGSVSIGYYGPFYYSDNDILFLTTLNKILAVVGIISLIIAVLIGIVMAETLSRPINTVINTAKMISKGNFKDRSNVKSGVREINELTKTVNNLAETLEKQEKLRKRLTADVAHELRTPITTLQSHMEAILDGIWEPTVDRIKSCLEETMRIGRMVGDLEKIAKYEGENFVLNKERFDIAELTRSIILNFQNQYKNKDIGIEIDGKGAELMADKDKISQVIVNLISNALKYTQSGGMVNISINKNNNKIEFRIKDNGVGISEEDVPYIFERFYRADKSRSRLTGGAGIGLTIVKSIVDAHSGSIRVASKIGEGTEFIVLLPQNI